MAQRKRRETILNTGFSTSGLEDDSNSLNFLTGFKPSNTGSTSRKVSSKGDGDDTDRSQFDLNPNSSATPKTKKETKEAAEAAAKGNPSDFQAPEAGRGTDAKGNERDFAFDINSFNNDVSAAFNRGELIAPEALALDTRARELPFSSDAFEAGIVKLRADLVEAREGGGDFAGTKRAINAAKARVLAGPGRKQTFLGGR
jgi:hypothetical protein